MITSPLPFSRSETKARLCFNTTLVSLHAAGAAYCVGRLERLPKWGSAVKADHAVRLEGRDVIDTGHTK